MTDAYPLQWPAGWERSTNRLRSRYTFGRLKGSQAVGAADDAAVQECLRQLGLLGARGIVISTNVELRQDGLPRAGRRAPDDTGVAVYFTLDGQQRCIPCDKWNRVGCNVYAIARTVDALRQLDRDGTKRIVSAAFSGFKALPALGESHGAKWWLVLDVEPTATMEEIISAYKREARVVHPDRTGKQGPWDELTEAYRQAKQARSGA